MSSENPNLLFVGNGSNLNRGCEAINRGTLEIINKHLTPGKIVSIDHGNTPKSEKNLPGVTEHSISISRWSLSWFVQNSLQVLGSKNTWFPVMGKYIGDTDVVLALGGDNYSMDYGSLRAHLAHIDYAKIHKKPFVIWGGSVGPFNKRGKEYEQFVAHKLRDIAAILAREDTTVEYLESIGITKNVRRVADPAFVMEPAFPPKGTIPFSITPETLGFNFSPLMAKYLTGGDVQACVKIVSEMVSKIIDTFDRPVVLVPHSQQPPKDDFHFLEQIRKNLVITGKPVNILPSQLNSPQIKWAIGQMACFAGARMHSTVASFSTCVPTLSFSYSIKSIGLNRDIFGHTKFLLTPEKINTDAVIEKLHMLLQDDKSIRNHLAQRLPGIREEAFQAGIYLKNILETGTL